MKAPSASAMHWALVAAQCSHPTEGLRALGSYKPAGPRQADTEALAQPASSTSKGQPCASKVDGSSCRPLTSTKLQSAVCQHDKASRVSPPVPASLDEWGCSRWSIP